MATISNTPRPGYVWDSTDNVWYPIGVGGHGHTDYITQATAVNPTIIDAKGDIITATAADTPARLAVGNNGETLVADSSTSTGLRYQGNFAAGKNKIINGDMNIWQRGTSFAVGNAGPYYGAADRWRYYHNGGTAGTNTISRQTFTVGQTDVPNNPTYFQRWTATTIGTSQTVADFDQLIEDVSTFAGQTATGSFYVKASGTFTYTVYLEQNFGSGGSASVGTQIATGSTTTGFVRVIGTAAIPSITGKTVGTGSNLRLLIRFSNPTNGATFDIANAQVEASNTATTFQTATGTLQGELAACQRYYYRTNPGNSSYALISQWGTATSTTNLFSSVYLPVTMRRDPTSVDFSTLRVFGQSTGVYSAITAVTLDTGGTSSTGTQLAAINMTSTGMTTNSVYGFSANNSLSAYIGFSAEL